MRGPSTPRDEPSAPDLDQDVERPVVPGLRVGRLLGRGGSACVWLVTNESGQRFALKVVQASRPGRVVEPSVPVVQEDPASSRRRGRRAAHSVEAEISEAASPASALTSQRNDAERSPSSVPDIGMADLARELTLLQRFSHEHLLRVHHLVGTDQGPGLLTDLAPGGSLLGLVTSRGPLPIPEVVTALVPVAQAVGYLHGAGALHGDVTPGNILFTNEGKPLLGDFGTGRLLGAAPGAVAGTPGFIDPQHGGGFDPGADVFALAAVAWFALTGRIPGPGEQRPPLALIVPEVPVELMQLIEDGLSSDRGRRPTADHFARALLASYDAGPVNLVPAVHASVLPELLTRPADSSANTPSTDWRRRIGTRVGRRQAGTAGSGSGSPRGHRPSTGQRGRAAIPAPTRPRVGSGEPRSRTVLAIVAGTVAAILLVAGIVLTLNGLPASTTATGGSESDRVAAQENAQSDDRVGQESTGGSEMVDGPADEAGRVSAAGEAPESGAAGAGGPADSPSAADPVAALGELAARRAQAFVTADPALLAGVDVDGSPAMAADRTSVEALVKTGRTLPDLTIDIRDPAVLTHTELEGLPTVAGLPAVVEPPAATEVSLVRATATLSAYTETSVSSSESAADPSPLMAAGQQELIFILWDAGDGWQIHTVVEPPA